MKDNYWSALFATGSALGAVLMARPSLPVFVLSTLAIVFTARAVYKRGD